MNERIKEIFSRALEEQPPVASMNAYPRNSGRIPAKSLGLTSSARRCAQALVFGLLLALTSGCASVDSTNASARPWGGPSDRELRENLWRSAEWPFCPLPSSPAHYEPPAHEQQRSEEWRYPDQWR